MTSGARSRVFPSFESGVEAMVQLERTLEPDAPMQRLYAGWFEEYRRLWPLVKDYIGRV